MPPTEVSVGGARELLSKFGFDAERSNERSALILLALLGLRRQSLWADSTNDLCRTVEIMSAVAEHWGRVWKPNTRETVRRFTLHQFVAAGLVEYNADDPSRAVNSPKANYRVAPAALEVIKLWGTMPAEAALETYLEKLPGQVAAYAAARELHRVPVLLPGGEAVTLSPGGQNVLLKAMVEEFCPRFTPGGTILYLGDADKDAMYDAATLATLGVTLDHHGKLPDLIVHMPDKGWLVLAEAASSHGPVDSKRHAELAQLFVGAKAGLVYVSCFPDRATMRGYLADLAWETDVWCADAPDHMVHFNGSRFLGPYE
ncbi:BsuBI/PstI family type II restriction endonuclease [Oerskovia sp. KBS0722]|uniref:BsuBI/PstI family type II restriction endonuclease n=1 Tax=Oerskovia sp. KBS0722 TaxID=1179673 RepID=UPI0011A1FA64|nr:BsuBI/PstI family type II restriction endonuclease [Oerskovia sp. KBS0722]QDW64495.1 restriction endonuclease [Oerskovia sp. KBS0722]